MNGGDGRRRSVQSISQLGSALSKEHLDPSTKIRVVWPKEKCKMLGEEVVIIDSPGKFLQKYLGIFLENNLLKNILYTRFCERWC